MDNKEKIRLAINQISINNCDGSASEDAIKAVRYLQEVSEAEQLTLTDVSKCDCDNHIACIVCGEEKGLDGDFWKRMKEQ